MGFLFWGDGGQDKVSERRKTMDITEAAAQVVANQLAIARQSIEDRDRRIWELQKRVELLEQMLNRAAAQQYGVPAPQAQPTYKTHPKRWTVR